MFDNFSEYGILIEAVDSLRELKKLYQKDKTNAAELRNELTKAVENCML